MEIIAQHPFVFFALLFGGIAALAWWSEKRRREELARLAAMQGLQYSPDGPDVYALENTGLEIFGHGRGRRARNLIVLPSRAGEISFFDYSYSTGHGKSRTTHAYTLALVACGGKPVPHFDLKPENFLHKIGEAIGFKDIDLPGFPVFSDKYRLTGPDEASVLGFFSPQRVVWLENRLGLRVQGAPGWLLLFKKAGPLPSGEWEPFMEDVKTFVAEAL